VKLRKGVHGLLVAVFEICVSFIFCLSGPINGLKLLFVVVVVVVVVVVSCGGGVMFPNESRTHRLNVWGGGNCPPAQIFFLTKINFLMATELKRRK